ncbi:MAG: hypothetical protein JWP59_3053 [Massilia sp.]|nr:hypothetical protein [Massilia sp.]
MSKPGIKSSEAALELKLRAALLLGRRVEGDHLVLADATLRAAIDGSRPLAIAERAALQASPLTLRRFRELAREGQATGWRASSGLLRAADSGAGLSTLSTDDGHWTLHFIGVPGHWQVVLQLDAGAPFAAQLLGTGAVLVARDGAGATIVQGVLDGDGECEQAWAFASDPAPHFQRHGAAFTVSLAAATG